MHSDNDNEFDGTFVNRSEVVQQVLGGTARFSPFDRWRVTLLAGRSREDSDNFLEKIFMSRFNTQRDNASWQNDISLASNQLLTLGIDYLYDTVNSTFDFTTSTRYNWGAFAQHQVALAAHKLELSLRHDDNQQFGSRVTGGINWGYALTEQVRLVASFGSAFKAPTFNELFFPNFGNPDLKPEDARSFELGTSGRFDWANWSLNLYETRIDNLISFDARTFTPANIDEARIRGLEAMLTTQIKGWQINSHLTFLDPINHSSDTFKGNILPRRSNQSFRVDTSRQLGHYVLGAMLLAEGRRYDDLENTRKLSGYVRVDLRAEYLFNQHWRIQGRIENLFDKHYETAAFFNQPGRNYFATLRYQP